METERNDDRIYLRGERREISRQERVNWRGLPLPLSWPLLGSKSWAGGEEGNERETVRTHDCTKGRPKTPHPRYEDNELHAAKGKGGRRDKNLL